LDSLTATTSDINKCWDELLDPAELPQPKQDRYIDLEKRHMVHHFKKSVGLWCETNDHGDHFFRQTFEPFFSFIFLITEGSFFWTFEHLDFFLVILALALSLFIKMKIEMHLRLQIAKSNSIPKSY